jgi:hypothetical protein
MPLFTACQSPPKPKAAFDTAAHKNEIQKWQSDRLASLTKADGWLTLAELLRARRSAK